MTDWQGRPDVAAVAAQRREARAIQPAIGVGDDHNVGRIVPQPVARCGEREALAAALMIVADHDFGAGSARQLGGEFVQLSATTSSGAVLPPHSSGALDRGADHRLFVMGRHDDHRAQHARAARHRSQGARPTSNSTAKKAVTRTIGASTIATMMVMAVKQVPRRTRASSYSRARAKAKV